jgi:hypothetical protein
MSFSVPCYLLASSASSQSPSSTSETNGENEMVINEYELERINKERRKARLPQLTRTQAAAAVSRKEMERAQRNDTSDFNAAHFLIGYTTGIPMPSAAGIAGAMMHTPPAAADTPATTSPIPESSSYKSGDDSPVAYDSGGGGSYDSGGGGGGD